MSGGAVRSHSSRRHTQRNNNASPYSRPGSVAVKKPSGWSLTGFLSYLNPLRSFSSNSQDAGPVDNDAALRLAARGEELHDGGRSLNPLYCTADTPLQVIQQKIYDAEYAERRHEELMQSVSVQPARSPPQSANGEQRTSPRSDDSRASTSNLKKVQEFLDEKAGKPLNQVEFAGLVSLLQNSVEEDDDHPEPFRFSKSPSTPLRGTTPSINFLNPSTSEQMVSAAGTAAQNGRKTLARNPMGVYRWQGGGSARPRNRYQSPGFGSSASRPTIKLSPEKPKTDSKRRRVGEDATSSSPQRVTKANGASTTPSSSSTSINSMTNGSATTNSSQANGKTNGGSASAAPTTPRIRTSGVVKPTTPAIPSPLRQTWGQSDSPPQSSPSKTSKPTRAASFMTELIKEVTPPKKPDFANPYEAVSPIPRPAAKKQPARKTRSSAKAEAEKQKEKEKAKEPELTPQAIIEATVPKGSKRSRPPPELIGRKSPEKRVTSPPESSRRSARINGADSFTNGLNGVSKNATPATEEVVEEEQPSPKKQRTSQPAFPKPSPKVNSVTVEEIDDVEMSSAPAPTPKAAASTYTLPSEVVEPGDEKAEKKRATSPSSTPAFPGFGSQRASFGAPGKSSAPKAPSKLRFSIQVEKDEKMEVVPEPKPVVEAPQPAKAPVVEVEKPKDARAIAAAMREDELPEYSFTLPTSSPGAGPSTLHARQVATAAPVSSLPTYDFSKGAAPAPAPTSIPASSGGFNWQAAGMTPPPKPTDDNWSCGVCMLSNPSGAEKCTVCDAPRADKPVPAAVQGFDWSKAGMKPPPKPAADTWACGVCMLSNPGSAAKCTVCDSPR